LDNGESHMRIGVTGHQDIPPEALTYVERGVAGVLTRYTGDLVGVSSLAAGADQIFATAILQRGGTLHAIIPCKNYEATFSDPEGRARFSDLLSQASHAEILDHEGPSEDAFFDAGRHVVEKSDLLIAVWDGRPAQGFGGTADIVRYAQEHGRAVEVVWPSGVAR
jgi:hypothetical protein